MFYVIVCARVYMRVYMFFLIHNDNRENLAAKVCLRWWVRVSAGLSVYLQIFGHTATSGVGASFVMRSSVMMGRAQPNRRRHHSCLSSAL